MLRLKSIVRQAAVVVVALMLVGLTAKAANNAEQVVFSTPGFCCMPLSGNSIATATPLGFWNWCAAEPSPSSAGHLTYQSANACQGSMYFYALDKHATGIVGFVTEDPSEEGIYTMHVAEGSFAELKKGGFVFPPTGTDYSCTLTNNDEAQRGGLVNSVHVECSFGESLGGGTGSVDVTNSVVNVTGPSE
jgi:hypothetical protein